MNRGDRLLERYKLYGVNSRIDGMKFSLSRKPDPIYYKYIGTITAFSPDHAIMQISRRIRTGDIIVTGSTAQMKLTQGWIKVAFNEKEV
ncbi:MAG: hypothetical protein VR69_12320 [Peptococcaceae bacterium BRH_c4b]|nr:MAG: hypothetical protein VR69_12320 [Peptococcaceae bacterium BRH_c4b]